MYYSEEQARKIVIEAGLKLQKEGLVARTWGNISARISEDCMIVTPSGRLYDEIGESDLVLVKISDASYEGNIKPTSERILHAACYKLRPDAGFIIHTHQFFASAISVAGKDFDFAPCAKYGVPGSQALADAVAESVKNNPSKKAFLMERHGAVCLGEDFEEAFKLSSNLEEQARAEFGKHIDGFTDASEPSAAFLLASSKYGRIPAYIDDFAQILGLSVSSKKTIAEICTGEDAWAEEQILCKNAAAFIYGKANGAKALPFFDALAQRLVYKFKYSKLKDSNK